MLDKKSQIYAKNSGIAIIDIDTDVDEFQAAREQSL